MLAIAIKLLIGLVIGTPDTTWTYPTGSIYTSPAVGDIDGDGLSEIVVLTVPNVYCIETDGTLKWERVVNCGSGRMACPIIANLDNTGGAEVIVKCMEGVFCFGSNGDTLWFHKEGNEWEIALAVANVDTSGNAEVLYIIRDTLCCRNSDGTLKWKKQTNSNGFSYLSVADIDKDSIPEILTVGQKSSNSVGIAFHNGINGDIEVQETFSGVEQGQAPSVADVDLDGDPEIIITCFQMNGDTFKIYCLEADGSTKWIYSRTTYTQGHTSRCAIANLDWIGKPEMVFYSYFHDSIFVIRENAPGTGAEEVWSAYGVDATGGSFPAPIICNMDGDNQLEVIWIGDKQTNGGLRIFDGFDGALQYENTDFGSLTCSEHGASAADVDADGKVEIVGIYGYNKVALLEDDTDWADSEKTAFQSHNYHITDIEQDHLWVPKYPPWHWLDHNTWLAQLAIGAGIEELENKRKSAIFKCSPNPVVHSTAIIYTIPAKSNVSLQIYNLAGSQVCTLIDEVKLPGTYTVNWNCRKDNGSLASSGIYFCVLNTEKESHKIKMIVVQTGI